MFLQRIHIMNHQGYLLLLLLLHPLLPPHDIFSHSTLQLPFPVLLSLLALIQTEEQESVGAFVNENI